MGHLHEGHMSLIRASLQENDITVCSVYVNPTQFNQTSDFEHYPRTIDDDLEQLKAAGCDAVFIPTDEEMYPKGKNNSILKISFGHLEQVMEGLHRPGHFNGVAHIVSKFFHIVRPQRAYFGLKDLQQFKIIETLTHELAFPIEIKGVEISRNEAGLALSSRNSLLGEQDKTQAAHLYMSLTETKEKLQNGFSVQKTVENAMTFLKSAGIEVEYFEIVNFETLKSIDELRGNSKIAICVAAYVKSVRLIDNIIIPLEGSYEH